MDTPCIIDLCSPDMPVLSPPLKRVKKGTRSKRLSLNTAAQHVSSQTEQVKDEFHHFEPLPWSPVYLSPGALDRKPGDGIVYPLVLGSLKSRDATSQTKLFKPSLDTMNSPAALNSPQLKSTPDIMDEAVMTTTELDDTFYGVDERKYMLVNEHCNQHVSEPESDGEGIYSSESFSESFNVVDDCIVGYSWWGQSGTNHAGTQTEPVTIDATTNTYDELPVFGYPSARSKMDYLERKVFGFNNHITPELLEAHVRCNNQHNLGNCDLVNRWANPLWALERKACDQWQANKELPRALQTFDWIDAARQKAMVLSWTVSTLWIILYFPQFSSFPIFVTPSHVGLVNFNIFSRTT